MHVETENLNEVDVKLLKEEKLQSKYNHVFAKVILCKEKIKKLENKIDKLRKNYPQFPSDYDDIPDNYVLISRDNEREAKWVNVYSEKVNKIGTWIHPSLEAWEGFNEMLEENFSNKKGT